MKKTLLPAALLLSTLLAALYVFQRPLLEACCGSEYRHFDSPDGRYRIVVTALPQLFALPGSAGDAPGIVRLQSGDGRVLERAPVEMVQNIQQIDWGERQVHIKLFADWPLPARSD